MRRPFTLIWGAFLVAVAACTSSRSPQGASGREGDGANAASSQAPVGDDTIRIDGSNGVIPLVTALADAFRRDHPGITVTIGKGMGSGARLRALAEGTIDIALASHGLDALSLSRERLVPHRIATTAVVFAVQEGTSVTSLTPAQLCDIFTGGVASWRALSSASGATPIVALVRAESEVDMEVVRGGIPCLASAMLGAGVRVTADTEEMRTALLATPGAIGVTTMTIVRQSSGRLAALAIDGVPPTGENVASGRYALVRDSYLVTRAATSASVEIFLAFMRSPAALALLEANGSVSAR